MLAACADKNAFEITVPVPDAFKDQTVMVINAQDGDTLALATATDSVIVLKGTIEKPVYAYIVCNNQPLTPLVVEPGKILIDEEQGVTGTPSNDVYAELIAKAAGDESDSELLREFMKQNPSNPHAVAMFADYIYLADVALIDTMRAHNPDLQNNPAIDQIRAAAQVRQSTSEGGKLVDFTLKNAAGKDQSLASLVEGSKLTIVDFWASWCGPCRAEIPNLVDLYKQYKSQGLQVVGVDVWEREEGAGQKAAKEMGIPYPILYGGTQETTDLYGILGIPTILVVDQQGNILARDIRGQQLADVVKSNI